MIKHQAFKDKRKMLKGNIHCHTTRSDGKYTPEDAMALYKENGYDFLAITDHRKYNFRNYAPELGLTIIPGMEFDTGKSLCTDNGLKCFHTVCIGYEENNGFDDNQVVESAMVNGWEDYQTYLDDIHAKNNLTVYCHPEWSGTTARDFEKQKGNFAMEIWNSGCVVSCDMDKDASYWDELLGQGIHINGVATDDCHKPEDACKGWVMVNAENNVESILNALKNGEFYSSCGPEIYDFYIENERIYVECSPVSKIRLHGFGHPTAVFKAENGELTKGDFTLNHWAGPYKYVRVSIVDKDGKIAWTNPIYLK